ncbi:hexose transporter protein [Dactylonectria macrodidyma]|uniref:Hexose transporter protein n=1 Tax=Dactylonectria macrodidyma TaxID=307937 RepID=A0A9P9IPB9_9HYPO|nr:hexose transporter protein [Dactylonectria macrodidyma]
MGGPTGNAAIQSSINYKSVPNNTKDNWWEDPGLRKNVLYCVGLCGTLFFNGYDGSLFNGLQTIDAWQDYFGHPKGNTLGLMNSAALFPGLVSPFIAERIAHRWGRRWAVWIGVWINVVGAVVNSAATSLGMYIAGRAIMGVGISMGLTIAPTLLQEFAHPRYRAPLGTIYTSIYYLAAVISAAVCLGTRHVSGNASWRIPCYLQLVGPLVTFALTVKMPESPRWLVKHGHQDAALDILATYHANGDRQDALVLMEFNEIIEGIESEQANSQVSYFDYLKPANRHRLFLIVVIAIGTNWVGNGIISYYLSPILRQIGVTSTNQQAGLNLGLQIWNLILSTTAGLNCDRVGRRPLWLTSNIGMLFTFAIVMGLSGAYANEGGKALGLAVIPFLFIFFGFYDIAWTPLANMYTVEILPYNLRAKGQAIYNITQGCANAINQWVNPIILDAIAWKYYAVYIGILSAYVVAIWFKFPETKNLTIEEIAVIFDGESAGRVREVATSANKMVDDHGSIASKPNQSQGAPNTSQHVEQV